MSSLPTALTGNITDTIVVKSQILDVNGLPSTSGVVWTTSDATIATVQGTVDLQGGAVIICLAAGSATITATSNALTAVFNLTVVNPSPGATATIDVIADSSFQQVRRMH